MTDLYDVHPQDNEFSARMWMWSLCTTKEADPLPTATFPHSPGPRTRPSTAWSRTTRPARSAIKRLNEIGIAVGVVFYVGGSAWLVTQAAASAPA